jgi:4-aminobutyrate aminotransferase
VYAAAAIATIKVLKDGIMRNAEVVGEYLMGRLHALMDKHPLIGDVRGKGLMIGVELVRDRQTKERATTERDRIVQGMFQKGVLILGAGRNAIRFAPPMVLTKDQADAVVGTFDEVLTGIGARVP